MLEIFCSQIAMAIERLHYAEVAQDALVTMESSACATRCCRPSRMTCARR
jgi:hypothetical protein